MRCVFFALIVAACGDNLGRGDAHIIVTDAPIAADAARFDARVPDAMGPDAMPGPSRVWVSGDWLADGDGRAGMFLDDAALPVVPSVVVPAGGDELGAGSDVVDVTPDGGRMVYVAVDAGGGSSLYIADGDGTGPMLLYAAPPGVEIGFASISPDALRVVFAADGELDGMVDLYLVAAGGGTPAKVSPDRVADDPALDVIERVAWSRTSRWVAFAGDLTEDAYTELCIADTGVFPPSVTTVVPRADIAATDGLRGVRVPGEFDTTNDLWFGARLVDDVELFRVSAFGGGRVAVPTPPRAGGGASEVGAIAIAPDGMHVAFAADAPVATAYEVYYAPIAAPAAAVPITSGAVVATGGPDPTAPMWFAPDGSRLALVGDLTTPGVAEPYVVAVGGGAQVRLVALAGNQDALALAWSATSTALFCAGDLDTDGDTALYRLDPDQPQTPALAVAVAANGDVTDVDVR